jgi:hypothetical protein
MTFGLKGSLVIVFTPKVKAMEELYGQSGCAKPDPMTIAEYRFYSWVDPFRMADLVFSKVFDILGWCGPCQYESTG